MVGMPGLARIGLMLPLAVCGYAQTAPFTLEQITSAAFPSQLTAAPTGGKVAWVSNVRGVRDGDDDPAAQAD